MVSLRRIEKNIGCFLCRVIGLGKVPRGMSSIRPVIVKNLPERLTAGNTDPFFREVEPILEGDRPRVVFNFSNVRHFDYAGVAVLLTCVEEVLKKNGDLKLAAVSAPSRTILELTRVDRLFEIFDNTADAIKSFFQVPGYQFQASFSVESYGEVISIAPEEPLAA